MKLATTTYDFEKYCRSYLEKVQHVCEAGFRYIDLGLVGAMPDPELTENDHWMETVDTLKRCADQYGAEFVQAHSPGAENPLAGPEAFEQAVRRNVRAIEICSALNIPNLVIHAGSLRGATKGEWFDKNRDFFRALIPAMEKYNVNVLHENTTTLNTPHYYVSTGEEMRGFAKYVDHPLFHACWDVGHANLQGSQYQQIMDVGDELYAVHIHDNNGVQDLHQLPFMGCINMDEIMHALIDVGFKGPFTLECDTVFRASVYWQGHRRVFPEDNRLAEPPLKMQDAAEKLAYVTGKYILDAYGLFEE